MSGELFKMMTGVDMVHVPYRGAALALTDLIAGQVQLMFDNVVTFDPAHQIRHASAIGRDHGGSHGIASEVPVVSDVPAGLRGERLVRRSAHPKARRDIVDKLNKEINAILAEPGRKATICRNLGRRAGHRARAADSGKCWRTKPKSGARW